MRMTVGIIAAVAVALGLSVWALSPKAESTGAPTAQAQHPSQAGNVSLLKVEGMTCSGCAAAVKMAATAIDGVRDATVSFQEGTAEVTYDPSKTTPEAIAKAVSENTGYKASVAEKPTS